MQAHKQAALAAIVALTSLSAGAESLPEVRVGPFDFEDAPIHVALTRLVRGTGVSVVMAEDVPGTLTATKVAGKLDVIIGKICAYSSAKCEYADGVLTVSSRNSVAAAPRLPAPPAPTQEADALGEAAADVPQAAEPWSVTAGVSLRDVLAQWAVRAGWELHWDSSDDFVLGARASFDGEFAAAVERLLVAVNAHGHSFQAETYSVNKVLRVYK